MEDNDRRAPRGASGQPQDAVPPAGGGPSPLVRGRSLSDLVRAEVERMILEGVLAPNQRVNENALAQALGVSRGPIREACSSLAGMGLMEAIPNRGFFVRSLSEEEARDVAEARAGVFAYCARLLASRVTADEIEDLRRLVAEMDRQARAGDATGYYDSNLEFHGTVARLCGNRRLCEIYEGLVRELHIQRLRGLGSAEAMLASNAGHRALVEALAARDPSAAFEAARLNAARGIARSFPERDSTPGQEDTAPASPRPRRDAPARR